MMSEAEFGLHLVHALLHQAPPEGITPTELDDWIKRNRPALLQVLEQALNAPVPLPPLPPPLVPITVHLHHQGKTKVKGELAYRFAPALNVELLLERNGWTPLRARGQTVYAKPPQHMPPVRSPWIALHAEAPAPADFARFADLVRLRMGYEAHEQHVQLGHAWVYDGQTLSWYLPGSRLVRRWPSLHHAEGAASLQVGMPEAEVLYTAALTPAVVPSRERLIKKLRALGRPVRVVLVGCAATKLDEEAPARELYTSPLFKAALAWGLAHADHQQVYVLSARHGLVELDQRIEPYNLRLEQLREREREIWGIGVAAALGAATGGLPLEITVLAGQQYARWIPGRSDWTVHTPLAGLGVGARLKWLKERQAVTTPGTRIQWENLLGWLRGWHELAARPPSARRYELKSAHLIELLSHRQLIETETRPKILRGLLANLTSRHNHDYRPKGLRAESPVTELIVLINNRLARLA